MRNKMELLRLVLALFMVTALIMPDPAWARAGGGRSMGSRGARTYSAPSYRAQPIQRSAEPRQQANPNYQNQAQPGFAPQAPQPGFMPQRSGWSPFWSGMAGGFLGMSAANMLFGHSGFGGGYQPGMAYPGDGMAGTGAGSALGGILKLLFFGGLIWFGWRLLRRRFTGALPSAAGALFGNSVSSPRDMNFAAPIGSAALGYGATANSAETPLTITAADQSAIGALLLQIQTAWSSGELDRLRPYITPEMQKYFSDALAVNSSRGLANKVEQVQLLQAEVLESWAEHEMEYATARLRWRALDYMVRLDDRQIAEGDATMPEEVEEIWTVARVRGGNWLLSAIQQTA